MGTAITAFLTPRHSYRRAARIKRHVGAHMRTMHMHYIRHQTIITNKEVKQRMTKLYMVSNAAFSINCKYHSLHG